MKKTWLIFKKFCHNGKKCFASMCLFCWISIFKFFYSRICKSLTYACTAINTQKEVPRQMKGGRGKGRWQQRETEQMEVRNVGGVEGKREHLGVSSTEATHEVTKVGAILRGRMLREQRNVENAQGMENAKVKRNLWRSEKKHRSQGRVIETGKYHGNQEKRKSRRGSSQRLRCTDEENMLQLLYFKLYHF